MNNSIYILSTGCQWRAIPKDFPPSTTLYDYFRSWDGDGTLSGLHQALYIRWRELADQSAEPSAAFIEFQHVALAGAAQFLLDRTSAEGAHIWSQQIWVRSHSHPEAE